MTADQKQEFNVANSYISSLQQRTKVDQEKLREDGHGKRWQCGNSEVAANNWMSERR